MAPKDDPTIYTPSASPGCLAPHLFLGRDDSLFDHFGVDRLISAYPGKVSTYNQYLFRRFPAPQTYEANLRRFNVDRGAFFQPTSAVFPDGTLYHGTRTPEDLRAILFQHILPSTDGTAGDGLYGVRAADVDFAVSWGGAEERVL